MRNASRLFFIALSLAVSLAAAAAQDLPAGTKILAQTNTDVKFLPATIVKVALDGYTVQFEDGSVQDVLQANMAYPEAAEPGKLAEGTLVAAYAYGDCYPGRIYELGEDGSYVVAWESSGADPVAIADIRLRMPARSDPRPQPPPPPPPTATPPTANVPTASTASAAPPPPSASGSAPSPKPESPAQAPGAAGGDDFGAALGGILGMAGDHYPMKYSLLAPTKSATLAARTDLADISLAIPPDYVPVGLDFTVKNRSGKTLAIDWSKCYVTSFAGAKRAVYHKDYARLEDIPAAEKPSELPAGTEATFSLFAREGVVTTFHPAHWDGPNWIEKYNEILNVCLFFGSDLPNALSSGYTEAEKAKDLELRRANVVGKSFKVGIAIVAEGKTAVTEFMVRIEGLDSAHEANMLDSIGH